MSLGKKNNSNMGMNRRAFVGNAAKGAGAFVIVPAPVLARNGAAAPNSKLNIAGVGIGGRGSKDLEALKNENIVALCDVDSKKAGGVFGLFPKAKRYTDYRVMLEKEDKNIDAVMIATPDHTHAVIAMAAIKAGKHVYCEKPLTHSLNEARALTEAARKYGVATQMGNQGHSSEPIRLLHEWVDDGAIGPVREVHAWSNRLAANRYPVGQARPAAGEPIPGSLDWDLWLGPAAHRPYHSLYHPYTWRAWLDFGTGAIGDMGCHILDPAFWALDLGSPVSVEATTTAPADDAALSETFPAASIVRYAFAARGDKPPVTLSWYDGGLLPPRPKMLEDGRKLGTNGALLYGDDGAIMHGSHGASPLRIIPEAAMKAYNQPEKTIPRVPGHHQDWINACKGGAPSSGNFDYAGPLTEVVLLGVLAMRCKNRKLLWDPKKLAITNDEEANALVTRTYREGWSL